MPIESCTTDSGEGGHKWGKSGHCYRSREDALKQGRAIEISKHAKGEETDFSIFSFDELVKMEIDNINKEK